MMEELTKEKPRFRIYFRGEEIWYVPFKGAGELIPDGMQWGHVYYEPDHFFAGFRIPDNKKVNI